MGRMACRRVESWIGDTWGTRAVARLVIITKSYAPDFELCADLSRSVRENAPETVQHHIIVPRSDLKLFARLRSSCTHVSCEQDFLPRSFIAVPFSNFTLNLRRPFPPVRGWIMQQVVKLAAVAASEHDVVVLADSDVEFVRPFTAETFVRDSVVRFFRQPNQIDERLPRHVLWHRAARRLLGLPSAEPPLPDYISPLVAWDPAIVRQMLERVAAVAGRPWPSAIAGLLHFSECVLYGVFIDEIVGGSAFASDDPLCLFHWSGAPLTRESAAEFLSRMRSTDIAAMISAKSLTPLDVKRAILANYRAQRADRLH
jgi:hypothetical protein